MSVNLKSYIILAFIFVSCVSNIDATVNITVQIYFGSASGDKNTTSKQCVYSTAVQGRGVNMNVKEVTTTEKAIRCINGYELAEQPGAKGCYKFHNQGATWSEANSTCVQEGSYLAVINSEAERDILVALHKKYEENILGVHYKKYLAVGIYKDNKTLNWMSVNGQSIQETGYPDWARHYPLNYPDIINAFLSLYDNKLITMLPYSKVPYICEH